MKPNEALLHRAIALFPPPDDQFRKVLRRQSRRQRRRRLGAGVVGLVVALMAASILARATSDEDRPLDPTPSPSSVDAVAPSQGAVVFVDVASGHAIELPRWLREISPERLAASPDGTLIAFEEVSTEGHGIHVADLENETIRTLTDEAQGAELGGWSPDSSRIVYSVSRDVDLPPARVHIKVVDVATGSTSPVFAGLGIAGSPSFNHDGSLVLFMRIEQLPSTAVRSDLWTVPVGGGTPARLIAFGGYGSFSPDGTSIAYRRTALVPDASCGTFCWWMGAAITIVPSDGTEQRGPAEGGPQTAYPGFESLQPQWSPDGSKLLLSSLRGFDILEVSSGEVDPVPVSGGSASWLDNDTLIVTEFEPR